MKEPTFVDVECWGRQAELVGQYLSKGRNCLCEGALKLDQWEDKAGNNRSKLKLVAHRVHFIGGQDRNGNGQQQGQSSQNVQHIAPVAPSEPYDENTPPF